MAGSRTTEIVRKIKPFVMRWINETVGGGVGAPSPHDLSSAHHGGSLADSQAPQFLKTDGSRTLTGNLGVSDAVTIDGVDVSVLDGDFGTHVAASAHAGHTGGVGVHTHQSNPEGGQIDHGLSLINVTANQHHDQVHDVAGGDHSASGLTVGHVMRATGASTFAWQQLHHGDLGGISADQHHNQVHGIAGGDHTVSGATLDIVGLTATDTLGVLTPSADPGAVSAILKSDAIGGLTLQALAVEGTATMRHVYPEATDAYDLGSSTKLWRKGWLSEMDAVLFAKDTATLLGGWFYVTKYSGTAQEDIDGTETQIDLGASDTEMSQNDFIVFRQALKVEYMQLGSYVGSNVWNVTRNVDGSGADTWPQGAPFACLGYDGDGRIELNAYDTPRISLMRHGTTYNSQDEIIRIGDLNGSWGYTSESWGVAIGRYASGECNIVITDGGNLKVRYYDVSKILINAANGYIIVGQTAASQGNIRITSSAIELRVNTDVNIKLDTSGNATFGNVAANQGNMYWNNSNKRVEFRGGAGGTTVEAYIDTDGAFVAGGGDARADSDGFAVTKSGFSAATSYKIGSAGAYIGYIWGNSISAGAYYTDTIYFQVPNGGLTKHGRAIIQTDCGAGRNSTVSLLTFVNGSPQTSLEVGSTIAVSGKFTGSTPPGAMAYRTTAQSIGSGSVVALSLESELYDTDGIWAVGNPTQFVPTNAGYYIVGASVVWSDPGTSTARLWMAVRKNGSDWYGANEKVSLNGTVQSLSVCSGMVYANGSTDYFEITLYQNTGNPLNIAAGWAAGYYHQGSAFCVRVA